MYMGYLVARIAIFTSICTLSHHSYMVFVQPLTMGAEVHL